jgi:hypothetical protein
VANEESPVRPDQFERVLEEVRILERQFADFSHSEPFNEQQYETAAEEMKKLEVLVDDGQRCIDVARGIKRDEAQTCLQEASLCIEEAQFWFSRIPNMTTRFKAQRALAQAIMKVEVAQFWTARALRVAREAR